jgi:uroporphyrinogen-III decarboxylase
MTMEKKWGDLSPEEKREERLARWLSPPNVKFPSPEVEAGYRERVTRFIKAIKLEEPDRVPVILPAGVSPAYFAESTLKRVMYDYEELRRAWLAFIEDFELDTASSPSVVSPGRALDILDTRMTRWPGHGLGDDVRSQQFVEGEYMEADEYDAFIKDPRDFLMRSFLPRAAGAFGGFRKLRPGTLPMSMPTAYAAQFGDPDVRASFMALLDAGPEIAKWQAAVGSVRQAALAKGLPSFYGGMSGAPFDFLGDSLRGTKGIMTDMYRRPEKLLQAMERVTPLLVEDGVNGANASGCPIVFMPLHKGTGGFMSQKQFETFYWPTLKRVMLGLIHEGCVPLPFAEGDYASRLETICDMPRASVVWHFEAMDMAAAKRIVGRTACIMGNVPVSLLCTGSPGQIKESCRRLIEACAPGGGYILAGAASVGEVSQANLRAMTESVREYGK